MKGPLGRSPGQSGSGPWLTQLTLACILAQVPRQVTAATWAPTPQQRMGGGGRKTQKSKLLLPWKVGGETPAPSWGPPQLPCILLWSRTLFCSCSCGALSWSEPTDARTSPSSGWPCSPACILGWSPWHPSDLLTFPLPCPTFCSLSALQPRFFPPHSQVPQSQEIPRELAGFDNCPQTVNYFSWASRGFFKCY